MMHEEVAAAAGAGAGAQLAADLAAVAPTLAVELAFATVAELFAAAPPADAGGAQCIQELLQGMAVAVAGLKEHALDEEVPAPSSLLACP